MTQQESFRTICNLTDKISILEKKNSQLSEELKDSQSIAARASKKLDDQIKLIQSLTNKYDALIAAAQVKEKKARKPQEMEAEIIHLRKETSMKDKQLSAIRAALGIKYETKVFIVET